MPSHSATLIKPKFEGLPLPEHSNRCGPIFLELRIRSSSLRTPALATQVRRIDGPWAGDGRCRRRNLRANVGERVRRDQLVGFEDREVGNQPGIETRAADLFSERLDLRTIAEERQCAEQFACRPAGDAGDIRGHPGQHFAGFHQRGGARRPPGWRGFRDVKVSSAAIILRA